jgi:hypothetical protein
MTEPTPAPEEVLNKMIGLVEGPLNQLASAALSSKLVLVPMSLGIHVALRAVRFARRRLGRVQP